MMHKGEDATVWIGYADFLMTLVIFFFIFSASYAARVRNPALVQGVVLSSDVAGVGIGDCLVRAGAGAERRQTTNSNGLFEFRFDGLWKPVDVELAVRCMGYSQMDTVAKIAPGHTVAMELYLTSQADSSVTVIVLPGDALFPINEYVLRPQARASIREVAETFRRELRQGELIAVQGHTDDRPFPPDAGTDNWTLSGQRAAAAARVLIESGIPECRIVTMGFGPSRPRSDRAAENRRIEFRSLRGADLAGASVAECLP
jgi:flagellar motor protein MotB